MSITVRVFIARLWRWLVGLFWDKPTGPPPPLKAIEVASNYTTVDYSGTKICMTKSEAEIFSRLPRKEKRLQARKFAERLKSGEIIFKPINGQLIAVKNKDYAANKRRT